MLFKELEESGHLKPDEAPGIYHIVGLIDVPFQIVITSELVGDEYATERAMIDDERANVDDIKLVMEAARSSSDENVLEYYRTILNLISTKNPNTIKELEERENMIAPVLLEILKPEIDEGKHQAVKNALFSYVQAGELRPEFAASELRLPLTSFISEMEQAGYRIPATSTM